MKKYDLYVIHSQWHEGTDNRSDWYPVNTNSGMILSTETQTLLNHSLNTFGHLEKTDYQLTHFIISLIIKIRHTWQAHRAILGLHWQCILVFVYSSILTTGAPHSRIMWLVEHIRWSAAWNTRRYKVSSTTPLNKHDSVQFLYPWFTEAYISDVVLCHHRLACLATHTPASPIRFDSNVS